MNFRRTRNFTEYGVSPETEKGIGQYAKARKYQQAYAQCETDPMKLFFQSKKCTEADKAVLIEYILQRAQRMGLTADEFLQQFIAKNPNLSKKSLEILKNPNLSLYQALLQIPDVHVITFAHPANLKSMSTQHRNFSERCGK